MSEDSLDGLGGFKGAPAVALSSAKTSSSSSGLIEAAATTGFLVGKLYRGGDFVKDLV